MILSIFAHRGASFAHPFFLFLFFFPRESKKLGNREEAGRRPGQEGSYFLHPLIRPSTSIIPPTLLITPRKGEPVTTGEPQQHPPPHHSRSKGKGWKKKERKQKKEKEKENLLVLEQRRKQRERRGRKKKKKRKRKKESKKTSRLLSPHIMILEHTGNSPSSYTS